MQYKLSKMTVDQRSVVVNRLEDLADQYLHVHLRYVGEADLKGLKAYGFAQYLRRSIMIDSWAISGIDNQKLDWIVTHEFGHHVYFTLQDANMSPWLVYALQPLVPSYIIDRLNEMQAAANNTGVSFWDYASELFAEAFAYMIHHNDIAIREIIDSWYAVVADGGLFDPFDD